MDKWDHLFNSEGCQKIYPMHTVLLVKLFDTEKNYLYFIREKVSYLYFFRVPIKYFDGIFWNYLGKNYF